MFSLNRLAVFCAPQPQREYWRCKMPHYLRSWAPELCGHSLTPLRWAIFQDNEHVVGALLGLGAEFPRLPDAATCVAHGGPLYTLASKFTVAILNEPCVNIEILKMFLDRHGEECGKTVFAETPLGLLSMAPDSPE